MLPPNLTLDNNIRIFNAEDHYLLVGELQYLALDVELERINKVVPPQLRYLFINALITDASLALN